MAALCSVGALKGRYSLTQDVSPVISGRPMLGNSPVVGDSLLGGGSPVDGHSPGVGDSAVGSDSPEWA